MVCSKSVEHFRNNSKKKKEGARFALVFGKMCSVDSNLPKIGFKLQILTTTIRRSAASLKPKVFVKPAEFVRFIIYFTRNFAFATDLDQLNFYKFSMNTYFAVRSKFEKNWILAQRVNYINLFYSNENYCILLLLKSWTTICLCITKTLYLLNPFAAV